MANKRYKLFVLFFTKVMFMNIYVGNLPYSATENSLKTFLKVTAHVTTAKIVTDKFTGSSRGFGFIEMPNADEAQKAIDELNGKDFEGRKIVVNESRPRETLAMTIALLVVKVVRWRWWRDGDRDGGMKDNILFR